MTPKRWFALFLFYISYLLFGASIYYHIENRLEREKRVEEIQNRIEINEFLVYHLSSKDEKTQNNILERISDYCNKPVTNYTLDQYEEPYRWTFYHAFFFAFTVCSTVGYGNLSPSTTLGQMIMIAYSLIGIPVNGILFAGLGDFFGRTFTNIYQRYKKYKMTYDDKYVPPQLGLMATIAIALVPGITFFIILPSLLFSYFEGWPYTLSIYFSYVTTTTIGFGDYVPTFQPHQEREFGLGFMFYQIFIIIWFIFALGYLLMIMTFITKGFRSKKLAKLEHQLSANIKATQLRIWNGVTKDVSYLRRILTELYMMKFKPVYNEETDGYMNNILPRSASCPELSMYRIRTPIIGRKRAFSENFDSHDDMEQLAFGTPQQYATIIRGSSDTDLNRINREKTFETAQALHHTTDLLARVVTALGQLTLPTEDDVISIATGVGGGYHGFPDSDILASEAWPYTSMNSSTIPHIQRARASSDAYISPKTIPVLDNEWTWGGDNYQIQQVINNRVKVAKKQDNLYHTALNYSQPFSQDVTLDMDNVIPDTEPKQSSVRRGSKAILKKLLPFRRRSQDDILKRISTVSLSEGKEFDNEKKPEVINYVTLTGSQDSQGAQSQTSYSRFRSDSLFPYTSHNPPYRRGSLFTGAVSGLQSTFIPSMERRGSQFSYLDRRGSRVSGVNRRGSQYSVLSQEEINQDVLENTTIADLIRALEVVHTQATLSNNVEPSKSKKQRKLGTASLTPPKISPLYTLFAQPPPNEQGQSAVNYSRRNTIFDTITEKPSQPVSTISSRRFSVRPFLDPPPYTEKESPKLKRRFSVRPTNLQIPPGQAPPPTNPQSTISSQSQMALQRRRSLRPSPLAREMQSDSVSVVNGNNKTVFNRLAATQGSFGRSSVTTRTHSPLSRIAQLQASRKISLPEQSKLNMSSNGREDSNKEPK